MVVDGAASRYAPSQLPPVLCRNASGSSPFVLVCDHASNRIPADYGTLGLSAVERLMHIAWDPGALALAGRLATLLNAPLVHATVSRLVIDCNRAADAPDLMPALSEQTAIPGNANVDAGDRLQRIARFHTPFHDAITALLDARQRAGLEAILVTIHSFTPVFKGESRPWPIGLIHGRDRSFTRALSAALVAEDDTLEVGWNQPYSAMSGVTHTLEHHGDGRGLHATMIEMRNNEILQRADVERWSQVLARCLIAARDEVDTSKGVRENLGA